MPVSLVRAAALALTLSAGVAVAQDAPTADTVVATVDGRSITLGDVIAVRGDLPEQYTQLPDDALYQGIREQLIAQRVLAAAAEAAGVADSPEAQRALAIQKDGLLADIYMRDEMERRLTDERLRAAYEERIVAAPAVEEVRASHILVAEEAKAADLRAQIDGGADFAALAAEHGTDGTKTQGGDLGYFTREVMVPEFADAAFAMEVGAVSQPVQTQFGWHLIKLVDKREQPKPAFDEVADALRQDLSGQIAREIVDELRAAAAVTVEESLPGVDAIRDDALIGR